MTTNVVWHGSESESRDLVKALEHNCTCVISADGVRTTTCPPHKALIEDQRFVDGVLYARHISGRLIAEEWKD
jgi:hypothetical protein